jgi:hypothetical protein
MRLGLPRYKGLECGQRHERVCSGNTRAEEAWIIAINLETARRPPEMHPVISARLVGDPPLN